jgi:hypothetical protein
MCHLALLLLTLIIFRGLDGIVSRSYSKCVIELDGFDCSGF